MTKKRKVILGIGNTLNKDEGIGVHLLNELKDSVQSKDVELIDGGTLGLNLLPLVEECSHLLILDAIDAGKEPSSIISLKKEEIPLFRNINMSEHQVTFQEVLGLSKIRKTLPGELYLIGIQPSDTTLGIGISKLVSAKIPEVLKQINTIIKNW